MGMIKKPPPCVRFAAVFSAEDRFLKLVWDRLESQWGKIASLGPIVDFIESPYYLKTMYLGSPTDQTPSLRKQMALFADPYDPGRLADDKLDANRWEDTWTAQWVTQNTQSPLRLVNIDPGYLSMTKLVLASTKNREHRIYLRDGIYADVTLAFRDQVWMAMPWTYADYQRSDVIEFLTYARKRFTQSIGQSHVERTDTGADR
jgi:hypothetical protein